MLEVKNISAGYGPSQVLFDLSLTVGEGEVVTLLGRNGMGKSTTVATIFGLLPVRHGTVTLDGKQIQSLPSFKIARLGLGLVPEGRQIFTNLSVRENLVATSANRSGRETPWTLDSVLELFPALAARASSLGGLLSGGEQQMLAIGRALMTNPRLLILDEATEGLAPLIRDLIWDVLRKLRESGQAILIIDKNVAALTAVASRHYVIEKGRIVWTGTSDELRADATLQERYLGV